MSRKAMRVLGRDDILGAQDIQTEKVEVPEWGGVVLVRGLTGVERDHLEQSMMVTKGKRRELRLENFRARLVAASVVDEAGARLFTDDDVVALGKKSAAAVERIVNVAMRLSGIRDEDVEEMTEDFSEASPDGGGSSSGSPVS